MQIRLKQVLYRVNLIRAGIGLLPKEKLCSVTNVSSYRNSYLVAVSASDCFHDVVVVVEAVYRCSASWNGSYSCLQDEVPLFIKYLECFLISSGREKRSVKISIGIKRWLCFGRASSFLKTSVRGFYRFQIGITSQLRGPPRKRDFKQKTNLKDLDQRRS